MSPKLTVSVSKVRKHVCRIFHLVTYAIHISEVRQYRKSSEEDGRFDTIWNSLQGECYLDNCYDFSN